MTPEAERFNGSIRNYRSNHSRYLLMFDEKAEKLNGRLAMIGVIAGIVSYVFTGHILPGVF